MGGANIITHQITVEEKEGKKAKNFLKNCNLQHKTPLAPPTGPSINAPTLLNK